MYVYPTRRSEITNKHFYVARVELFLNEYLVDWLIFASNHKD